MTMMEVMIGMVLAGLLLVGMNYLWVAAGREFDNLALRQKAIFRLNSEMERLVPLYLDSATPAGVTEVEDYATALPTDMGSFISTTASASNLDKRWIYNASTSYIDLEADMTVFGTAIKYDELSISASENFDKVYRTIGYYDASGAGAVTSYRNLVWIDRSRNVVAQISWELQDMAKFGDSSTPLADCYPTNTKCKLLTLYLDYPFRYVSATSPRENTMGPVETITLQTIVGAR